MHSAQRYAWNMFVFNFWGLKIFVLTHLLFTDTDSDMVQTSTEDATTSFNGIASVG